MKQSVRVSGYGDYIALDFLDKKENITATPFYIKRNKYVEVHWSIPSNERVEYPQCYDNWFERYLFKFENGILSVRWINGVFGENSKFSEVKPNELTEWQFEHARKIINL